MQNYFNNFANDANKFVLEEGGFIEFQTIGQIISYKVKKVFIKIKIKLFTIKRAFYSKLLMFE